MNKKSAAFLIIFIIYITTAVGFFLLVKPYLPTASKYKLDFTSAVKSSPRYYVQSVAEGLQTPTSITFTHKDRLLLSEKSGLIKAVDKNILIMRPFYEVQDVWDKNEAGVGNIAIDPNYNENFLIYISYTYQGDNGDLRSRVIQLKDNLDSAEFVKTIIDNIPASDSQPAPIIKFGPDSMLYIGTGDAGNKNSAQDLEILSGKILRITPEGKIPSDNPIPGSPVWTLGHRSPVGLSWNLETGNLWELEKGPALFEGMPGGDELNLIKGSKNYGWPVISHNKTNPRLETAVLNFTPAEEPFSGAFYNSGELQEFEGNLFFGAGKGGGLLRVVFDSNDKNKIQYFEKLFFTKFGRIRAVETGPDGNIYFSTDNYRFQDEPNNDGKDVILRIVPLSKH